MKKREYKKQGFQSVVLAVCHGLGGMDKTQLALDYVHHATQPYAYRVEFNVEFTESLTCDYREFCQSFHVRSNDKPADKVVVERVKDWLSVHPGWLLVYDNAPDDKTITSFLPKRGRGDILVTSRYASRRQI